jgi:hypothetical protein
VFDDVGGDLGVVDQQEGRWRTAPALFLLGKRERVTAVTPRNRIYAMAQNGDNMDETIVDQFRTLSVEIILQTHLHVILVGRLFGVPFHEHEHVTDVLVYIEQITDQIEIMEFPNADAMTSLLDSIQAYEEMVIAIAQDRKPDVDVDLYDKRCSAFDQVLATYQQRAYLTRLRAGQVSLAEELHEELGRRGLTEKVVVSGFQRKSRTERAHARKLRRAWLLHTAAGKAYTRELAKRRRRHHNVDRDRSRTAKQAARLYADER